MFINTLVFIILSATAWLIMFPQEALTMMAEHKRRLRLRVIRRTGIAGAEEVRRQLYARAARQGIDPILVEQVLAEHYQAMVERLGSAYADEILGEADPIERYD